MSTPPIPTDGPPFTCTSLLSNAELLRAARAGRNAAWAELISRYDGAVRGATAAFRLQDADADDVAQNTWLRLMERGHTIRDPQRLGGWLITTAGRECLALLRNRRRELVVDVSATELLSHLPGPEALVVAEDLRQEVAAVVAALTGRRRQLVDALFYRPDPSYAQLRDCGIPQGSIGPTRGRALRELREGLERRGIDAGFAVA
jgi:RNA polymerase sigma factor (sigma-70 family)